MGSDHVSELRGVTVKGALRAAKLRVMLRQLAKIPDLGWNGSLSLWMIRGSIESALRACVAHAKQCCPGLKVRVYISYVFLTVGQKK